MGKNRGTKRGAGQNKTEPHKRIVWTDVERQSKLDISWEERRQVEAGNSETDITKHRGKDTLVEVDTRFLQ